MSRSKLLAFIFSVVFLASLVMLLSMRVKADSNEPITFSSGLTLYSPVNTTYSSNIVECNGTFNCPKGVQSSLNYSIDGNYQEGLPWKLNAGSIPIPAIYIIDGSFQLPQLSNGTHQLSIGIDEALYSQPVFDNSGRTMIKQPELINSSSWINTVYFTISSNQSILTPASTPTSTPTITPTPTVPEFPTWVILPLFAVATFLSIVLIRKIPKK
jgi:hypothetical protein